MKIYHINHSDARGGAARAAYRLHRALRSIGFDSTMLVNRASTDDWTIEGPKTRLHSLLAQVRPQLAAPVRGLLRTENPIIHSPAVVPSRWAKRLNNSAADVVHLHWINGEMMSVRDIGQIAKPVVWTLHDMWAFCGAEHITYEHRWRDGYQKGNRPTYESGFDLNRWTWARKSRHWRNARIHVITPSRWLANCVRESALMRTWPVTVIPNPIDTERWQPVPRKLAREILGLPSGVPIILFGAMGASMDANKGFELLKSALRQLEPSRLGLELLVLGAHEPPTPQALGMRVHYAGTLHDDVAIRVMYSAADVTLIPSRLENYPNAALESLACGTPVVAFNTGGIPEIVLHKVNGYLAERFRTEDLADGILWVLRNSAPEQMRTDCRATVVKANSAEKIAAEYAHVYRKHVRI